MRITRRAAAAALALSPAVARAKGKAMSRPLVIAHRGASGERPEHTLAAYRLAIAQGADFIEPDLVATKDGHLVARHENEIGGTTDVAGRPEFAARRTAKAIDGETVEGWFTEDFTLSELRSLRARERLPELRPASAAHDGQQAIPTLWEVIDLAKRAGVGVYPEMKHPTYFRGLGLPLEERLAAALKAQGLDRRDAPVFVQCFEAEPLARFKALSKARRVFLQAAGGPAVTAERLREIAGFADGFGPDWSMVIPTVDGALGLPTSLVADAHAAGLQVHPWTVRAENHYLPPKLRRGADPRAHGDVGAVFAALYAAGVDGVFSDFPGLAVKARDALPNT